MCSSVASPMVCLLVILLVWTPQVHCQSKVFNVMQFGAVPDGKTDNSKALLKAWSEACKKKGAVLIPSGTFLVTPVTLNGPCSGRTTLKLDGVLKAPSNPYVGTENWISFNQINGLTVSGSGSFDAQGATAWKSISDGTISYTAVLPTSLKFNFVTNGILQGITSLNSKYFHIGFFGSENFAIRNIKVSAPGNSPNTDGIHIGNSNYFTISDSIIATGDDCISLGPGSTNVNISRVLCGPGHGISIGSLGRNPGEKSVNGITIRNCNFTKTQNGLRIKTLAPSPPGNVHDVTFRDIFMNNVYNPIIIDQHYCPNSSCPTGESSVKITFVKFIRVHGSSSTQVAANFQCSKNAPCEKINLQSIRLTYNGGKSTSSCSNVKGSTSGQQIPPPCF